MSEHEEPLWDCLPHDPQTFFGLDDGFDLKALKRSYNKLLRRFKPERFPEEFQKIRAAYEMLDGSLRYGRVQSPRSQDSFDWKASESLADASQSFSEQHSPAPNAASETKQPAKQRRRSASLHERLQNEPAEKIYAELSERNSKSPYEFYALAALSDLVVNDDRFMFIKWLLAGLKEHPDEPGLFSLVYEYFKRSVPDEMIPRMLVIVSDVVSGDRFYYLTERLWDRLLTGQPFESFHATLSQCEANLRDYRIEGKIAFYIHVLRRAMWKAPDAWLNGVTEFINTNYEHITDHLEYDLELSMQLDEYRRHHQQFLNGHPVRAMIHDAIVAFCQADDLEAERSVIECQARLGADIESLFTAFPIKDDKCHDPLVAWHWVSNEILDRTGYADIPPPWEELRVSLTRSMQDFDDREDDTFWGLFMLARRGMHLAVIAFCMSWPFWLLTTIVPMTDNLAFIHFALMLGSTVFYLVWGRKWTVSAWFDRLHEGIVARKYNANWRPVMVRVLTATHTPFSDLVGTIRDITQQNHHEMGISTWLHLFISRDYGLLVYSIAQQFQR